MIGTLQCVVLDCPDVHRSAGFYQALLGGEIDRPDSRWSLDEDWATLHVDSGQVLAFQRAEDHRAPRWPDPDFPQQFHLDVGVADLDAAHRRVLELGARLLDAEQAPDNWRVYADLDGHPFCLVRETPPAT